VLIEFNFEKRYAERSIIAIEYVLTFIDIAESEKPTFRCTTVIICKKLASDQLIDMKY